MIPISFFSINITPIESWLNTPTIIHRGAYTVSDNAPAWNSGLTMQD